MRKSIIIYLMVIIIAFGVGLLIEYWLNWRYVSSRKTLWNELRPVKLENCTMSRYGAAHDGGYLLCGNLLNEAQKGYSYGIAGRDSWGCDVSKKHKLLVHQYDCFDTARPVCDGGRFEFHEECLGSSNEEIEGRRFNSLAAQIEENGDLGKWLLIKMDIEGAEAESLLATPSPVLEKVIQLVVEFHDVDNPQYLQVIKYLKKTFYVVDVHFNNFGCKDRVSPFPGVVYEVLFVNKRFGLVSTTESRPIYPNPLWRPNSPELSDCQKEIR
jgi:hypothetical protein